MARMVDDNVVERIDRLMAGAGFKKQRKHITGKRPDNLPDLLLYSHEKSDDFVTLGLEDRKTDKGVSTTVEAKFGRTDTRTWESLEGFESDAASWIAEHLGRG